MIQNIRIARPVSNLTRAVKMYTQGLGLTEIGRFENHDGFDGVMLEQVGLGFHFEFTHCRTSPIKPSPTPEDLVVFYVPSSNAWRDRCEAMLKAGFAEVTSHNPYWDQHGRTFEDPDGYRVVIQQA
ncbi:MAG: VOC family protein [Gammaproteobacteria bacterium]|nr:VOC family protein [Gammaproteobacteria bacterium]